MAEYPFKDLLPLDEVLEREGYYKDWTHLDPEVFYSLTQISEYIKTKGYGVDVRLLIAQLAEHFGLKTTQVVDLANLLQQKFENLEGVTQSFTNNINSLVAQMEADKNTIVANATVDSEVILARGGKATLGQRLDDTTAQLAQTKGQFNISDTYIPQAPISLKAIYSVLGAVFIVTPKPHGDGYIRVRLQENVVTTTESAGLPGELLRVTGIDNVLDCFVMQSIEHRNSGSSNWTQGSIAYVLPTGENQKLDTRQIGTRVAGAWIEYELDIPVGVNNVEFLIYGTNGSSTDVDVSVDGTNQIEGLSLQRPSAQWFSVAVPVIPGKRIVRFTTNTSQYMTFAGAFLKLKDMKKGFSYDKIVTFHQATNGYITATGAMDYALYDADESQWVGSYHGGETRERLLYVLDGKQITLNDGDIYIGNVIEIEQDTDIVNKLKSYTRQIFKQDGTIEHEVVFNGDINLTRMFTVMSTTADTFDDILYPVVHTLSGTGNYYLPSGINYIVQRDRSNNQKAITVINNNMIPPAQVPRPYIKKTPDAYNKVYMANIDSADPVNFKGGNFRTVHIFE